MASANPPSDNHQPARPTGDLEHLFRQKLAEAEVRPRANFWDQLDHELVAQQHADMLRQNAMYRQRAAVYRWAAAACLVLALGVASWAYLARSGQPAGPVLATTAGPGASSLGLALPETGIGVGRYAPLAGLAATRAVDADEAAAQSVGAYGPGRTLRTAGQPAAGYESAADLAGTDAGFRGAYSAPGSLALLGSSRNAVAAWGQPGNLAVSFDDLNLRDELGLGRPGQRRLLLPDAAPAASVAKTSFTPEPTSKSPGKLWKRLRIGGGYALSVFNPNINFSRADARTKADPVTNALRSYYQDDAEREYRRNLRSGPSQRVALTASYQLRPHWTVSTGAEWAESRASSATSFGFLDGKQVGSQAPDIFAQPTNSAVFGISRGGGGASPQSTSYRYRTAAVPVSLTYGSQKAGISLYAKAGAVVSLLLNSRSELEGSPEATRSYDIRSSESPYRTLFASGRMGGGVRYQPALSTWNVTVGPNAEVFITPLNANPSQRAARQTRPYSVGLEATIEFGSAKVMSVVQ